MAGERTKYPPLPIIKAVCKELGWTYDRLAIETQKHTGTTTPGPNYIAQCVSGDRCLGRDTAKAMELATGGRLKREWLVWGELAPDTLEAVNG
ncbi:MAG TPA: hypothetical protein PK416_03120 [Thermodesulfobacteriota bacterium]|nr:hypothetical protein [Thermodesulfobacteriota bacterium]